MARGAGEREVGVVVGGSLSQGVQVRLSHTRSVEDIAVGAYVSIEGQFNRSFGMITDVKLESIDKSVETMVPDLDDPFVSDVLEGTAYYGIVDVLPTLIIDPATGESRPVRTVPRHFSSVVDANMEDIRSVFGVEDETHLGIGQPLAMENVDIVLDLKKGGRTIRGCIRQVRHRQDFSRQAASRRVGQVP